MNCPNCGSPVTGQQGFCGECGHDLLRKTGESQEPLFDRNNIEQQTPTVVAPPPMPPQPPSLFHPIPQGFVLDSNSGLYYRSSFITDPLDGQAKQFVRYFNPETGQYMDALYPWNSGQSGSPVLKASSNKTNKTTLGLIALILAATAVILFVLVNTLGRENKNPKAKTPVISSENSEKETYKEFKERREKEEEEEYEKEMEEWNKPISLDDLDPLIEGGSAREEVTQSESLYLMFKEGDYYYFSTLRGQDKTYTAYENPEEFFALENPKFFKELMALKEKKEKEAAKGTEEETPLPEEETPLPEEETSLPEEETIPKGEEATPPVDAPVSLDFIMEEWPGEGPFGLDFFQTDPDPDSDSDPDPQEEEDYGAETVLDEDKAKMEVEITGQSYLGNSIYRIPVKGGAAELVMTAGDDTLITGFYIEDDQVIYSLMANDETGFGDYYATEMWIMTLGEMASQRRITETTGGPWAYKDGFLYQIDATNNTLNIWGRDSDDGSFISSNHDLDLLYSTLHMDQLYFYDDNLLLIAFDYNEMRASFIEYNIKTGKKEVLYQGEEFYLYRSAVVSGSKIYTVRYEGYHEGRQNVEIGIIDTANTMPSFVSLSTVDQVAWKDKTPFLYLNEDKEELYYQKEGKIVKAPLTNLTKTTEILTLVSPVVYFTDNILVFEDGSRYDLTEKEDTEGITYGDQDPLVTGGLNYGRNPERYLYAVDTFEDFNYLEYDLNYTFPYDQAGSVVLNAVMNTAVYFEEESYYSLYSFEYPEYSRLLLEEPSIASVFISPEGYLDTDNWCRFLYDALGTTVSPREFKYLVEEGDAEGLLIREEGIALDPEWVREDRPRVVSFIENNAEENAALFFKNYTLNLSNGSTREMELSVSKVADSLVSNINVGSISWEDPEDTGSGYSSDFYEDTPTPAIPFSSNPYL